MSLEFRLKCRSNSNPKSLAEGQETFTEEVESIWPALVEGTRPLDRDSPSRCKTEDAIEDGAFCSLYRPTATGFPDSRKEEPGVCAKYVIIKWPGATNLTAVVEGFHVFTGRPFSPDNGYLAWTEPREK